MNLWVKRTWQLALIAVALFFLSCKDDVTPLGFRNPKDKFNVKYVEIPLESSVYLIDSIRTSNFPGELGRLLVGKYNDPAFGAITANGFMEISPYNSSLGIADADLPKVDFDSVRLDMRYDFYSYGTGGTSDETFNVHLLTELISSDSVERAAGRFYSKKNDVDYDPDPIGTKTVSISGAEFKVEFDKGASGMDNRLLSIRLDSAFGESLLARAKAGGEDYTKQEKFNTFLKGLAVIPGDNNQKVIGFDHVNGLRADTVQSRLVVFFHLPGDTTYRTVSFNLNYRSFTNIEADRNAGNAPDLFDIPDFYTAKEPPVNRYSQTGTGVVTRIDFGNFYAFADTVEQMLINSAELVITGYESPGSFYPINSFSVIMLDSLENIRYRNTRYGYQPITNNNGDTIQIVPYIHSYDRQIINSHRSSLNDGSGFLTAFSDGGTALSLRRDGEKFSGYMTLLAQQFYLSSGDFRYRYFGLFPTDPQNGKTINRLVFNKDNLRLKIYYTTPINRATN
jgi:hypothetical protein